ncbi:uncharacterized protein LOC109710184 isoform X2 [Ananas comosus]|uniref:Uncharacterized protein LOC109710184 isoform X2 n=1 Tax=Ananas comosus TaxID=4615 RepID=A0A6P5F458_ANACO|nr:uncharacterized protein LOC109710184 isoform X2 [Ananas comosus]
MSEMEGELISTTSEAKADIESEDAKTEVSMVSIDIEPSSAHDLDRGKLVASQSDIDMEPCEGMEFESEEAARAFYSAYARHVGFRIRISRYTRSRRDNSIISRRLVCSKEGFREVRAHEGFLKEQRHRHRAITRVGCKAMIMVKKFEPGKWVVTKFVKEHNHGPVPPRKAEITSVRPDHDLIGKPYLIGGDTLQEPFEGMEFDSEDAAKLFYINYARSTGFRARISKYCRSRRDNSIISRQIVCSKEGFREMRVKKEISADEGKAKRPRMITRIGCKAMIIVKKVNSGKWVVTKFEKEHNHDLLTTKKVPYGQLDIGSGKELFNSLDDNLGPNGVKIEGECYYGTQGGASRESLTVLYNQLCHEAIKYAQEGSVTEEIYNVAMSALKEAVEKVSAAKRGILRKHTFIVSHRSNFTNTTQGKSLNEVQCSNEVQLANTEQQLKLLQQQPVSLVLIPSNFLGNSGSSNCSTKGSVMLSVPSNGGQGGDRPEDLDLPTENKREVQSTDKDMHVNGSGSSQNSQEVGDGQISIIQCSDRSISGPSKANMVAVPALPVTLYMPVMGSLPTACAATPGRSYTLVATPVEALPLSSCPAEQPVSQSQNLAPSGHSDQYRGPNPLVHATAIACGARVVPPKAAASLIRAIEAKIKAKGVTVTKSSPHPLEENQREHEQSITKSEPLPEEMELHSVGRNTTENENSAEDLSVFEKHSRGFIGV